MNIKNKSDLKLVELKKYNHDIKKIEYELDSKRAIVIRKGDKYVNIFDETEEHPLLKRVPYSNDYNGVSFGTKLIAITNPTESGLCYVEIKDDDFERMLATENLSITNIENYILRQDYLFDDVVQIAKKRLIQKNSPIEMIKILKKHMTSKKIIDFILTSEEEKSHSVKRKIKK